MVSETDKQRNDRSSESGGRIGQFSTGIRAIAAVVIVMLGISLWFWLGSNSENAELYAQHFAPYEMVLTQRSIQQGGDLYKEAIGHYNSKDYIRSMEAFQQLTQFHPDQPIFKLYECMSIMSGGLDGDMEVCLTPLLEHERLAQQARWFLGLSYLRTNDTDKAREMFSAIRSHEYKYVEAQEILGSLEE